MGLERRAGDEHDSLLGLDSDRAQHQYYCAKDSGFWVYKTLDQWKVDNLKVLDTLIYNKGEPSSRQGDMQNYADTYFLTSFLTGIEGKWSNSM